MIAVIDNYDSFTYNLVQFLGELIQQMPVHNDPHPEIRVWRNDEIEVEELAELHPSHIVISPGPGSPDKDSGISNDVIRILGAQHGQVIRAPRLMHGKVSPVHHKGTGVFKGLPSPMVCTRYHSLIVAEPLPDVLEATAFTVDGELMGLRHKTLPIHGVQFHPESILTEHGKELLANFLKM
jgi:anthranilate synthase/aminodeoxychorismate synthase-like glutamine amidotransferase